MSKSCGSIESEFPNGKAEGANKDFLWLQKYDEEQKAEAQTGTEVVFFHALLPTVM